VDYTIVQTGSGFDYVFDITAPCREWAEGISTNYGFTIMDQEEIGNYTRFYSSEHSTLMPVVEIGYIDPAGLKDYWTYSSQDCGAAGTGYVSDYTGLLSWSRTDFSFATEKQTLGLSFFFDITQKTANIGSGLGWKTNYSVKVGFDSALGLNYSIDGSGSKVYYHSISSAEAGESSRPMFLDSSYQNYYLAEDGSRNIL
jgi:hypothetical protein